MAGAVDIPGAISQIRYMAGWATKIGGEVIQPYTHADRHRVQLHDQGAGRRLRADRAVELPADDGVLKIAPGARRRLLHRCSSPPSRPA